MAQRWFVYGGAGIGLLGVALGAGHILKTRQDPRFPIQSLQEGLPIPELTVVEEEDGIAVVRYEREGVTLFAEVFRPKDVPGKRPAVVIVPGGFDGPNYHNRLLAKKLAARGYLAAVPHLRGTGKSGGQITFCGEEGRDVQDLARALPQIGSSGPYCYVGISFGAPIAMNAGQNDGDLRGIAHVFGPTDFLQQRKMLAGWKLEEKVAKWDAWIGGSPEEAPDEWERRNPLAFAPSVKAPLLILQAGKDVLVPASQASRLALAREQSGATVHRVAVDPAGLPWNESLEGAAKSINPLTGRGPYAEDNLIFFAELPHTTNDAVFAEVFRAVDAWLAG